jgi:hypothetical protein
MLLYDDVTLFLPNFCEICVLHLNKDMYACFKIVRQDTGHKF